MRYLSINSLGRLLAHPAIAAGVVFVLALGVRLPGLRYGLPYLWHPDEPAQVNLALHMLQEGTFNPERFNYPSLYLYLQMAGLALGYVRYVGKEDFLPLHKLDSGYETGFLHTVADASVWEGARQVSAFMGALACALTFLAAREWLRGSPWQDRAAWLAALLLAASPLWVENARYATVDVSTSTAAAGLLWATALVWTRGERRDFFWAGVAAGLLTAFKYNAALGVLAPLAAWLAHRERRASRLGWGLAIPAVMVATFACASPYVLFGLPRSLNDIGAEIHHYQVNGHLGQETFAGWNHAGKMAWFLLTQGFPASLPLGALGVAWAAARGKDRVTLALIGVFPAIFFLYMSGTKVFFARNLCPLGPSLALLLALGLLHLWDAARALAPAHGPFVGALGRVVGIVCVALPMGMTLAKGWELERSVDSRVELARWLHQQEGMRVAVPYELRLSEPTLAGLDVIPVSMVSETPEDWARKGATHVIGSPALRLESGQRVDLQPDDIVAIAAWFQAQAPLAQFGFGAWSIDTFAVQPLVALYALPPAPPATLTRTAADDEVDTPERWSAQPPALFGRWVRFGSGLTTVRHRRGDPNATVCGAWVPAGAQVGVRGYWRRETIGGAVGFGARLTLRFTDHSPDEARQPLLDAPGALADGVVVLSSGTKPGPWERIDGRYPTPPGGRFAQVCAEVDAERGEIWLDDLQIVEVVM